MRNGQERRQWKRRASKIPQMLVTADAAISQEAVVLDESLTGVSVLVTEGANFQSGQVVQLSQGDRSVSAIVRNVRRQGDGNYHLGLEWGPCEIKPASLLFLMP